jgi:hypothetical protein
MKLFLILLLVFMLTACDKSDNYNVNVQSTVVNKAADSLDLQAVGVLAKTVKSPQEFEEKLNQANFHSLDLDDNGLVDYINVTGYGTENSPVRGFSLTVNTDAQNTQEIAQINIEKIDNQVSMNISGNQGVYGDNHHYHSNFDVSDFLLYNALYNQSVYHSPYHYGYYPPTYVQYKTVEVVKYKETHKYDYSKVKFEKVPQPIYKADASKIPVSPNKDKVATNIKAVLAKPTESQRAFQIQNPAKQRVQATGFGNKPQNTATQQQTKQPPSWWKGSNSSSSTSSTNRPSATGFGQKSTPSKPSSPSKSPNKK